MCKNLKSFFRRNADAGKNSSKRIKPLYLLPEAITHLTFNNDGFIR